jgi:hypothetical protein
MQREFGKRALVRSPLQAPPQPIPAPAKKTTRDPTLMRRAVLAIALTVTIVGGMFLIPRLGQCDGQRGLLGLDWCRLMKASVEGGSRGLAIGRGMTSGSGR